MKNRAFTYIVVMFLFVPLLLYGVGLKIDGSFEGATLNFDTLLGACFCWGLIFFVYTGILVYKLKKAEAPKTKIEPQAPPQPENYIILVSVTVANNHTDKERVYKSEGGNYGLKTKWVSISLLEIFQQYPTSERPENLIAQLRGYSIIGFEETIVTRIPESTK